MTKDDDDTMCYRSELEAAVRAVRAEREAIIQMVRLYTNNKDLENAIRARSQDPMPLFDDWGGIPYKSCPPCNQQCNQGRDCPNA